MGGCRCPHTLLCPALKTLVPPPRTRSPQLCPAMSRRVIEGSTAQTGCASAGEIVRKYWRSGSTLLAAGPSVPRPSPPWREDQGPGLQCIAWPPGVGRVHTKGRRGSRCKGLSPALPSTLGITPARGVGATFLGRGCLACFCSTPTPPAKLCLQCLNDLPKITGRMWWT